MRAYLDANVLIAYNLGPEKEEKNYPFAKKIFDEIKIGTFKGIISYLVLQEVLNVFRRIKAREYEAFKDLPNGEKREYVRNESRNLYYELLQKLLEAQEGIVFEQCKGIDSGDYLPKGLELLSDHFGDIRIWDRECPICKNRSTHCNHKGLSPLDINHVLLAWNLTCERFVTLDKDFKTLSNEPRIAPLKIVVLE